ncbi:glycoside hydrolase family 16 protein [Allopontixanthobacter sp.]|uniref:glycoside hydrolase family 16 protein n=1 Tax=Allopontixanthobacter sp. TaxID=2906452 RepID=UPI002ABC8D06|nr:glycoside hydrolase family 16 protein [Allopontixanthobacter sp.]MDZ4307078.1 glycoside hydrolase family 16 protein [Allopontixanthobacter sp.]
MNFARSISLLAVGLTISACQHSATAWASPAPENSTEQTLLFADEFNDGELDRQKWNVIGPDFWVNNEQQAYIDSPETIRFLPDGAVEGADGGVLVLQPNYRKGFTVPDGRKTDFVSGRIDTRGKFDFTYGRATARIKMPDAAGVWPAFWLLGNGRWPNTGEIDIMEYVGEADWTGVALHGEGYSGETPLVNKYFFPPETDVTQWHEYSAEWTPDEVLFKVDGRLTYRATRVMAEHYGKWSFDNPKHVILNFALGGAYPFKTNGIETPYNGLPASTVELVKQGEIAMYVDWVRVYRAD